MYPAYSHGSDGFVFRPLTEQQAIVEQVDSLLAMVDELEKQVTERKTLSEELMQAVLREAFAGGIKRIFHGNILLFAEYQGNKKIIDYRLK